MTEERTCVSHEYETHDKTVTMCKVFTDNQRRLRTHPNPQTVWVLTVSLKRAAADSNNTTNPPSAVLSLIQNKAAHFSPWLNVK